MKKLHKLLCLFLSFVLSTYTLPVFAATVELSSLQSEMQVKIELTDSEMQTIVGGTGSVDATMSEYIRYDPTSAPKAEAVVSNRSTISLPYILEVMDINGPRYSPKATNQATKADHKSCDIKCAPRTH